MGQNGRAANDEWLRSVLERHESALIRYATRMTGSTEQARDVVQETFVRLCRQKRAELDGHLTQWLYTVCRNRALTVRRKETRMTTLTEAAAAEYAPGLGGCQRGAHQEKRTRPHDRGTSVLHWR